MGVFVIIIFIIVLFHFIYEGIIAPSERDYIRYSLNACMDEIKIMKIQDKTFSDTLYNEFKTKISYGLVCLNDVSIYHIIKNYFLNKRYIFNQDGLSYSNIEKLKKINYNINKSLFCLSIINSIGWIAYLGILIVLIISI